MGRHSSKINKDKLKTRKNSPRYALPKNRPAIDNADQLGSVNDSLGARVGTLEHAPSGLKSELDKRKRRNKRITQGVLIGFASLIVLGVLGGFAYIKYAESMLNKSMTNKEKLNLDLAKVEPIKPYNLLILGYDKQPEEVVWRSDVMLLARIDPQAKKVWMISLPRDYRVTLDGHGKKKLNAAYQIGGEELAIQTVETLTGQKINHYMGVNFDGFQAIVDAMGGVEIDVQEKFDDPKADRSPDLSASKIDTGLQRLDGVHAMTFVRSRNFPDGDFSRMRHQQQFFKAIADQAANQMSSAQIMTVAHKVIPYMNTSMKVTELLSTIRDLKDAGSANIYTTTLPGKWVSPFIIPDEEAKAEILDKFAKGEPFELTPEEQIAKDAENLSPAGVKLDVRNGTTRVGLGKQAAAVLKARGFTIGEVGNTDNQTVYDETLVVYKTSKPAATLVSQYLQPGVKIVESRGMYAYEGEVLLVIGKDWDVEKIPVADIKTSN